MSLAMSELLQTAAVAVASLVLLTLLALFFKAKSATWKKPEGKQAP